MPLQQHSLSFEFSCHGWVGAWLLAVMLSGITVFDEPLLAVMACLTELRCTAATQLLGLACTGCACAHSTGLCLHATLHNRSPAGSNTSSVVVACCCPGVQVGVPGGASLGMMGSWPSPDCVCNDFWQQTYTRTGVLEFSRDRCVRVFFGFLVVLNGCCRSRCHCRHEHSQLQCRSVTSHHLSQAAPSSQHETTQPLQPHQLLALCSSSWCSTLCYTVLSRCALLCCAGR